MAYKNPIGWFEIYVNDFEKAKEFYSNLFGWEFKLSKTPTYDYWNINTGENSPGGGLMKKTKPSHDGQAIMLYIETDDIDSVLAKAAKIGGKIEIPKTRISETSGSYAIFRDADNNLMGLWSK